MSSSSAVGICFSLLVKLKSSLDRTKFFLVLQNPLEVATSWRNLVSEEPPQSQVMAIAVDEAHCVYNIVDEAHCVYNIVDEAHCVYNIVDEAHCVYNIVDEAHCV